ncbi:DNA polymerase [Streptomyces sp. NPDC056210]|uniref:DNA polymerase n=1 Tax=Streptomyces sp. NPDC056210 TaxID=3345746 RepID=UPI0035D97CED
MCPARKIAGDAVEINVLEGPEDVAEFVTWARLNESIVGCDTETTGLDWWADDFRLRTVQFGNATESWVIPVELDGALLAAAVGALRFFKTLIFQNGTYDLLVLDATTELTMEELWPKVRDTKIYAHLVDNRTEKDGGIGHSLYSLTRHYIDDGMAAKIKGSMNEIARSLNSEKSGVVLSHYKVTDPDSGEVYMVSADHERVMGPNGFVTDIDLAASVLATMVVEPHCFEKVYRPAETRITKDNVWKYVPWNHPGYLTYAGLDPVLTFRLFYILKRKLPMSVYKQTFIGEGIGFMDLPTFEHKVAEECSYMSRRGIRLDIDYTEKLADILRQRESEWTQVCRDLGVENPWSNKQLMDYWMGDDENGPFDERHPEIFWDENGNDQTWVSYSKKTGALSLSDDLLEKMEEVGDLMAMAVRRAKSARKKRTTWLENFLSQVDSKGFVHASINSIQATTARMSITGIPAQTLPSGDWEIRRCFLADEGEIDLSTDYMNMELRFLAAWSGDERMLKAFIDEEDLHQVTADGAGVSRKLGKMANFLTVFGGGPGALATQAGISVEKAAEILEAFKRTFPGVAKFMEEKTTEARRQGYITTPSGRRLYVDKRFAFRGTNYFVQSGSRDITCRAILRLAAAGFRNRMLLPIHDEILFTVPADKSKFAAKLTADIMQEKVKVLMIPCDPDAGGSSWGSLYMKDAKGDPDPELMIANDEYYRNNPQAAYEKAA